MCFIEFFPLQSGIHLVSHYAFSLMALELEYLHSLFLSWHWHFWRIQPSLSPSPHQLKKQQHNIPHWGFMWYFFIRFLIRFSHFLIRCCVLWASRLEANDVRLPLIGDVNFDYLVKVLSNFPSFKYSFPLSNRKSMGRSPRWCKYPVPH